MKHVIGCTTRPYNTLALAEAFGRIAAAGYSDVAVFNMEGRMAVRSDSTPDEVATVRKAATDAGLNPSMLLGTAQLALGPEAALDDYRRLIDNAAALGAAWLLDVGTSDERQYAEYYELMRRAAPHAADAGVNVTLKPHGGITLTAEDLVKASDEVGHPAFGICYDPGNIIYYTKGGRRPETDVAVVAPKVTTAIIKDCTVTDGEPDVMVTPGEGLVDFQTVIDALIAGGFTGPFYVECVGGQSPEEIDANVRATLRFVCDVLGKNAGRDINY